QGEHIRLWLGDSTIATYSIIAVNIWRWIGFPTLVFHAAIDSVPTDCIESAILDGAGEWKVFKDVLLPLIVPAITVITVLTLIGSLNVFEQIYTMAGFEGGPSFSTDTLGTLFFRTAFGGAQSSGVPEVAIGSALSVVIYILTTVFSLISIIILQKREVEL
ncbi:MAG: sugar ABC transporter permease, partial [Spirochaetales bacterium]|nr:sugar ABC transporter permease [Spirochaetales bacterium]